jgi:hypothetical protein
VVALLMAPGAEREILASNGELGGLGVVRVARICAVVSIGLALVGIAVGVGAWLWFVHWAHHHHSQ